MDTFAIRRRPGRTVSGCLAVCLAVAAALVHADPAAAADVCSEVPAPALAGVSVDSTQNAKFATYGNSTRTGWTGGDSTYSVDLPGGGGRLWLFSDTFLGPVNPDGSRPTSSPVPNQTFVREQIFALNATFYTGAYPTTPGVVPKPASGWYWLREGTISGTELHLPLNRFEPVSGSFRYAGTAIARFSVSDLTRPIAVTARPSSTAVQWGAWVQKEGAYTYIYGTEDLGLAKYMKVARVDGTSLTGSWRFFAGGDFTNAANWVTDESQAVRLALGSTGYGVSNEYSVHRLGSRLWVLITMDTTVGSENGANISDDIVAYFACTPVGPFTAKTFVYDTPETGPSPTYDYDPDIVTYNPHSHPQYIAASNPGRLVVSYNVNSTDKGTTPTSDLYRDVTIYRPRFIDVQFTGVS